MCVFLTQPFLWSTPQKVYATEVSCEPDLKHALNISLLLEKTYHFASMIQISWMIWYHCNFFQNELCFKNDYTSKQESLFLCGRAIMGQYLIFYQGETNFINGLYPYPFSLAGIVVNYTGWFLQQNQCVAIARLNWRNNVNQVVYLV